MRKAIIGVGVVVLSLLAARIALADARYTDPAGDSGAAPDITAVTAANDAAGNLTLTVTTNRPSLPDQSVLTLFFDTDGNSSTGGSGVEYYLVYGGTGGIFYRWNGTAFVEANPPSLSVTYGNGALTLRIAKADVRVVSDFVFYVTSQQYGATGAIIASDNAPDGSGSYDYTLSAPRPPLTLRAAAPVPVPSRPVAGKAFAVRVAVTRGDTGARLASGLATCKVALGLKPLRAVGSVRSGRATCSMLLPRTAKGKRIRGTIKVTFRNVSVTKAFSYRVP